MLHSLTSIAKLQSNTRFFIPKFGLNHETNFSSFRCSQEAHTWIPRSYAHAKRQSGYPCAARERPGTSQRLSVRQRFGKQKKLRSADIIELIESGSSLRRAGFVVLARGNSLGLSRFAVIVPKRIYPRAVDRNRMKRMLREWFRRNQYRLHDRDIVVRMTRRSTDLNAISDMLVQSL